MRSGTIALLLGILCVQHLPSLADASAAQFLPLLVFVAWVNRTARLAALFLCGFLWATLRAHVALAEILPAELEGADLVATGRVVGIPVADDRRTRFEFHIDTLAHARGAPQAGAGGDAPATDFGARIRLYWYGAPALHAGDRWRLHLRLRAPRGYANPAGFDYERWLFINGIRATGYVRDSGRATRLDSRKGFLLDRWRQRVAEAVMGALAGGERAGIVAALAVGMRGHVDADEWRVFRDTGTAHLMAISGLHVGLVAGFAFWVARFAWSLSYHACLIWPAPRAGAVAALVAAAAYAAMAGFSLPTQRALIMLAIVLWCLSRDRATAFSVTLCAALAAVILIDPFSVLGPSLWLSFGAVGVLAYGMMNRRLIPARGTGGLWWRFGRAQLLATLGLAPVLLASFGQLPLLSPLANVLAIPWTTCLLVPGAVAGSVLAVLWPEAGRTVLTMTLRLLDLLWPVLETLADRELMLAPAGAAPPLAIAAAAVGVLILSLPRGVPCRWLGVLWLAPLIGASPPAPPKDVLWFTLLDVGHGLAAVARTRHHTLVFDTGPKFSDSFDAGSGIVAPFLRGQGITRLDAIVVSHPDNDHAGGLKGLLSRVPATTVVGPSDAPGARRCRAGVQWRWDGYDFRLLHPPRAGGFEGNDASCVLRISGPGGSILVAADVEARAERRLVAQYAGALASDILVAPHHGSRTSSTAAFIRAVAPSYVLFSAGDRRRPRLPDDAVVQRYLEAGARALNTATSGAVTFELAPDGLRDPDEQRVESRRYWRRD